MNSQVKKEYICRINRVIDYIENNIEKELTLKELASVANFSEYHFHRIFTSVMKETLFSFIQRLKLEKSVLHLTGMPNKTISEVCYDCGFSSPQVFSKAFKQYYKLSPSEYREKYSNSNFGTMISNQGQVKSNIDTNISDSISYFCNVIDAFTNKMIWSLKMKSENGLEPKVEILDMPDMTVAYIRHIGPYAGDSELFSGLFDKLFRWAGPRNLINFPETKVLSIYHDNPEITEKEKLRVSVCITVPENTKVDGEVGLMMINGGKYASAYFELLPHQYGEAWDLVFGKWLPESGYQCDDKPCFELYGPMPEEPDGKHKVYICIPVIPL